jgi:hypothetical protein
MSKQLKFRLEVTKYDEDFKGVKLSCRHFTIVGEEFGPSVGEVLGYCGQEFADFLNSKFPHKEPAKQESTKEDLEQELYHLQHWQLQLVLKRRFMRKTPGRWSTVEHQETAEEFKSNSRYIKSVQRQLKKFPVDHSAKDFNTNLDRSKSGSWDYDPEMVLGKATPQNAYRDFHGMEL